MEAIIEKYNDWKKIEGFINCLKKSINWICLVNDDIWEAGSQPEPEEDQFFDCSIYF